MSLRAGWYRLLGEKRGHRFSRPNVADSSLYTSACGESFKVAFLVAAKPHHVLCDACVGEVERAAEHLARLGTNEKS